jgi:hypothetical protein
MKYESGQYHILVVLLALACSAIGCGGTYNRTYRPRVSRATPVSRAPEYDAVLLKKEWLKHYFMTIVTKNKGPVYDVYSLEKILPKVQNELARCGHAGIKSAIRTPYSHVSYVEHYIKDGLFWNVIHYRNTRATPTVMNAITINKFAYVTLPAKFQNAGTPYLGKIWGENQDKPNVQPNRYEVNAIRSALDRAFLYIRKAKIGPGSFDAAPILDGYSSKAQAFLAEFGFCQIQDMLINGHSVTIQMKHVVPKDATKTPTLTLRIYMDYDVRARCVFICENYEKGKWQKSFAVTFNKKR